MKIKKVLALLVLLLLTTVLSLSAKSVTIKIAAYVPETISFEQTQDSFEVKTNMSNVEYDFLDNQGYLSDAQNAQVLSIRAL